MWRVAGGQVITTEATALGCGQQAVCGSALHNLGCRRQVLAFCKDGALPVPQEPSLLNGHVAWLLYPPSPSSWHRGNTQEGQAFHE